MLAAYNGHTRIAEFLLEHGARVDARNPEGRTALMFAATGSFPETAELLLNQGADPDATGQVEGWSPIMFAAAEGRSEVVQVLLEEGANPSLKDKDGEQAIDFATKGGHSRVTKILKQHTGQ
jgi:ankyrin repeat protein